MNAPVKLKDLAGMAEQIAGATARVDALESFRTAQEPPLDATADALHTPRKPYDFAAAARDIEACAPSDAVIEAQDALDQSRQRFNDTRALPLEIAVVIFGTEQAWRDSLARQGMRIGRQMGAVYQLKLAAGMSSLEAGAVPPERDYSEYSLYSSKPGARLSTGD